jgi:hypothetical protein
MLDGEKPYNKESSQIGVARVQVHIEVKKHKSFSVNKIRNRMNSFSKTALDTFQ